MTTKERNVMQWWIYKLYTNDVYYVPIAPLQILEIGTYTGYGTLCLAEGLASNGKIFTIDRNEELINIQNKYFEESKVSSLTEILGFLTVYRPKNLLWKSNSIRLEILLCIIVDSFHKGT